MLEILTGALAVFGSLLVAVVAVAFVREKDAISRINSIGPATALGLPLVAIAVWLGWTIEQGFDALALLKTMLTIGAMVVVSSVGSNVLGRAAYLSGTPLDESTEPNDLAKDPDSADSE